MKKTVYPLSKNGKKINIDINKQPKISIKELKPFLKYYSPYKMLFISVLVLILFSTILNIVIPILTGELMQSFVATTFSAKKTIIIALIVLILSCLTTLNSTFLSKKWDYFSSCAVVDLKSSILTRINNLSAVCFDNNSTGFFSSRLYDVYGISNFPLNFMNNISSLIIDIGFLAYSFVLNIYVGIFMAVTILIQLGLEFHRIQAHAKYRKEIRKINEQTTSFQYENIRGIKDIKCLNCTQEVVNKLNQDAILEGEYGINSTFRNTKLRKYIRIIKEIISFAFIALSVYLISIKQINLAVFLVIYNYRNKINSFATAIVNLKSLFTDTAMYAQRINELMDEEKFPLEQFGKTELTDVKGNIKFKNVSFAYNNKQTVLNNISFEIKPNTMVSIVGKSGVGKTTIVSLLNKLYALEENNGEILLDNVNINTLTKNSLRDNICIISQTPYIFNMSVAQNLRVAKKDATDEELIDVLNKAQLYDYIESQPDKLNTMLGENGLKLSGGQRQRLAIARALLKPCKVLVFDESTSALDNENQAKIKQVVRNLSKERTIIVIAHRLSTIVDSDNIIYIDDGKILKQGTHFELMNSCEKYKSLYQAEA